ncbi:bifunctional oligoribonuclease/PAP phosphatase NrnA, partial [bacterium]|nr:bifunctional oligoribonuclease/PAP phosphatase NrnA [bacterium]
MVDQKLISFIESLDNYVITFHQNPDGDALGSALGLHLALKKLQKHGHVISPNSIGEYLHWLSGIDEVLVHEGNEKAVNEVVKNAGAVFCLDFNDLNRTGTMENVLVANQAKKVLIDHHLNPKQFAAFEMHDIEVPATALLIFRLLSALDNTIFDQDIATCLYTGLMTDTGSFRFPSTTPETHLAIARLMQTGFNHSVVHENIFDTFTVNRLHLFGHCIKNQHELLPEYNTSIIWVTRENHTTFDIKKGDTEGLVNYNLSLQGIKFGVLFIEDEEMVKISFRSKGDFPANLFASNYFQGGGHFNAAGGRSFVSLEKTIRK